MTFILHLALGGCLKAPPVAYGVTADTGGHIAYILEAALEQARLPAVDQVSIVTRRFSEPSLDPIHAMPVEPVAPKVTIERIATRSPGYLEKEALGAELESFTEGLCAKLAAAPRLPTVIHAHFADAAAVASEVQRRFGIPFVYTPHSLGIDKRDHQLTSPGLAARIDAERQALRDAAAIIVSSRGEMLGQVGAYGVNVANRIHVLAPGAPRRGTMPASATLPDRLGEWLDRPERPIILAVARPVVKKNLQVLLRAFAADAKLRAIANLVIVAGQHAHAKGEEAAVLAELHALAAEPALAGCVALPPAHDEADVAALYRRAAEGGVFVNPALHEPFGLTLIEAAAAGVPVLATANGGPADIVSAIGHGRLIDPLDVTDIADKLVNLLTDTRQREALVTAARGLERHYCWARYARRSLDLYTALTVPALLVCDIDGTLTGSLAGVRDFRRWHATAAMPFVVATGRDLAAARTVLRQWALPEPDAFIVDVGTRIVTKRPDGTWADDLAYAATLDEQWDPAAIAASLDRLTLEPQPPETHSRHKLSFFGDAAAAALIRSTLRSAGLAARVVFSHDRLIDVLPANGGKAAAIAHYAADQGFHLSHCIAAGDSGNDADMLAACGHGIVVGNAHADLDRLPPRPGLHRVDACHAHGVLEGLARIVSSVGDDDWPVAA